MRRLITVSALMALLAFIAGCGGGGSPMTVGGNSTSSGTPASGTQGSAGAPQRGGSIAVGIDSDPAPLDPINQTTLGQYQVMTSIYDSLLSADAKGKLAPGLVTSWKQDNRLSYTLHLRRGVTFTDGTPFNAAAVKFNIQRIASKNSSWYTLAKPIKTVEIVDPHTVVLHLSKPYSPLLSLLATHVFYMVSPTAVRKEGSAYGRHPVGTGPFELVNWVSNSYVKLRRNSHYWQQGLPYLDSVRYDILPDSTTKTVSLVSGRIQTVDYLSGQDISRVQNVPNLVYQTWPGVLMMYVAMNPGKPPLNDPKVREAIAMAIDRQSISKDVEFGLGQPARSVLSPAYWAYSTQVPAIPYDPARAKQLLGGRHFTLSLQVPPTYTQHAQVIKSDLAKIGITANLTNMDWSTLVDNYFKSNFVAQIEDQSSTWPDPDDQMSGFYTPQGAYNGTGASDPAVAALITKAEQTSGRAARKQLYIKAQTLAQKDAFYAPVFYQTNARATASTVHGIPEMPDGTIHLAQAWVSK